MSLYDEGENNGLEDEMDIINDEDECKKDVKIFTVKRSKVKNYFKSI